MIILIKSSRTWRKRGAITMPDADAFSTDKLYDSIHIDEALIPSMLDTTSLDEMTINLSIILDIRTQ